MVDSVDGKRQALLLVTASRCFYSGCVVAGAAKELVDERRAALGDGVQSGGVYLTYLLSNANITIDEIYSNVMEMLFAGTDTVGCLLPATLF